MFRSATVESETHQQPLVEEVSLLQLVKLGRAASGKHVPLALQMRRPSAALSPPRRNALQGPGQVKIASRRRILSENGREGEISLSRASTLQGGSYAVPPHPAVRKRSIRPCLGARRDSAKQSSESFSRICEPQQALLGVRLRKLYAAKCKDLGIAVTEAQERRFVQLMRGCVSDRKLKLAECELGPEAAKVVAGFMRSQEGHSSLDLRKNNLGNEGIKALC